MADVAARLGVSKMTVSRAPSRSTRLRSDASEALRHSILVAYPQITTVTVDSAGIGTAAGRLLLTAIAAARSGQVLPPETVQMPCQIELRGST